MTLSDPLSGAELAVLRHASIPHSIKPYLSIVPQQVIAAAQINQSTFDERVASLTIDNTSGDWSKAKPGMTLWVGTTAGSYDVGIYRIRGSLSGSTLPIGEINPGDPGLASLLQSKALAENQHLSLVKDVNLHGVKPRIVFTGSGEGSFYKDYDLAYTSQNENAPPCWVNLGEHRAGWVDPTAEVLTEAFTATALPFLGESVLSYFWEIDHDPDTGGTGTIITGTAASQSITVEFEPGHYLIWCTVSLSSGAVMRACRHVFAHQKGVYEPYRVNVSSIRKTRQGSSLSLTLDPQTRIADTPILSGTMCLLWEETRWSGDVPSTFSRAPLWLQTASAVSTPRRLITTTFELKSTAEIVAVSQLLDSATVPTNWQEAVPALMHLEFWCFYLLHYHSTVLMLHDVSFQDVQAYEFTAISEAPGGLFDQIQRGLQRLNMEFNQRHDGTLIFTRHPLIESTGDRDNRPERMTLTEADVIQVDLTRVNRARVDKVELYGFVAGGIPVAARTIAYGPTGGQGMNQPRYQDQLVLSQAELNERAGMIFAFHNQPYDRIALRMARNWAAVIEPAEMYWVRVNLPASMWPEGSTFNRRCLVKEVTKTFQVNGAVETMLIIEPETLGVSGRTMPIYLGNGADDVPMDITFDVNGLPELFGDPFGDWDWSPWPADDLLIDPNPPTPPIEESIALTWAASLFKTTQLAEASPSWASLFSDTDDVQSVVYSAGSPFLSNPLNALYLWVLTEGKLFYSADALAISPTFDEKQTLSNYLLLRNPAGVTDGIAAFAEGAPRLTGSGGSASASSQLGGFTADKAFDGILDTTIDNRWSSANATPPHWLEYDFETEVTVSAYGINCIYTNEAPTQWKFQFFNGSTWDDLDTQTGVVWTEAGECQRFILSSPQTAQRFRIYVESTEIGWCSINELLFWDDDYGLIYSDDTGTTKVDILTNPAYGDTGGDVDDFNLGIIIHAAKRTIVYTTSYFETIAKNLLNLTGVSAAIPISCVRIPYRKLATQALNNDPELFQFIYGLSDVVGGATLWGVTFDTADGTIVAESDMTPIVSSETYYVIGPHALETAGANTQHILAFGKPVGGGDTVLLRSINGGTTWAIVNTSFDGNFVRWVPGSTTKVWVSGPDGIGYSEDAGATITAKTGDLVESPVKGVYAL